MSWRTAARALHRGVLNTLGETAVLYTPGGATVANVPVSFESDELEDEADDLRYIRGLVSAEDVPASAGEFAKGWTVAVPEGRFLVTGIDEKRVDGIAFRARRED